ncbi:hypothetical protein SLE2022_099310 [Rubroshorea leprosula]
MASLSGNSNSTSSTQIQNSGSEGDLQLLMDQRKRKRKESNRESARRSRMRKQKHLDDLMAQASQLRKDNNQILSTINISSQNYVKLEAENSILRAQMVELSQRLDSLNEILSLINTSNGIYENEGFEQSFDSFINPLNMPYLNQPIMASSNMFPY